MFEGFACEMVDVGDSVVRVRHGGDGPAVVLLHGHPRTHTTWHRVAPILAERFTVVCPDLRGYGRSAKPPAGERHENYSKRAMAQDVAALMSELGHERFAAAGHDRGGNVAFRLALDHPERVGRLVVMDAVGIGEALARCDAGFAASWWHWWFLAQTEHPAEPIILADPDAWYGGDAQAMGEGNHADYRAAIHDPETVRGMCEDYRAGLTVDREHDEADRATGRRVRCPVLCLWSTRDDMEEHYGDPTSVWTPWADHVSGRPVESAHHMAEEAPEDVAAAIGEFLA